MSRGLGVWQAKSGIPFRRVLKNNVFGKDLIVG